MIHLALCLLSPNPLEGLCSVPVASEGTLWLRDIIWNYSRSGDSLTTHGLKATLLTWCTISGALTFEQRRAMGHHVDPGSRAPLCYSRDNAVQTQVQIALMVKRIAHHFFDPDLPRRAAQVEVQLDALLAEVGNQDEQAPPADADLGDQELDCASDGSDVCTAEDLENQADDADVDDITSRWVGHAAPFKWGVTYSILGNQIPVWAQYLNRICSVGE